MRPQLRPWIAIALLLTGWLLFPHAAHEATPPPPTRTPVTRPATLVVPTATAHPIAMPTATAVPTATVISVSDLVRRDAIAPSTKSAAIHLNEVAGGLGQRIAARRLHHDLYLHAVGSQLETAWNAPVTLKAINWYGFEYAPFVPGGLDRSPMDDILSSLHALGFNALRITFADQTVEQNPIVTQGLDANPALRGLHSLDIMQRLIQRAHHYGLRVILCNSRSEAGGGPETATGLWYTNQYTAQDWVNDWLTLARRFRHDSAFVGADLRNEPHITGGVFNEQAYVDRGPLWGPYHGVRYDDRDWHYAAQTLGNRLLGINPHLLIVVEGVQVYVDPNGGLLTSGLWGSNLEGVQYDPIVLSRPGQLVYSVHEYGPQMWQGDWFHPGTTYAKLAKRWNHLWGYLLDAGKRLRAPIFVGEFGTCHEYRSCVSDPLGWKQGFWFQAFVRYLREHPQVGWAYWALNPNGPFHPNQIDYYSLASLDWQHYYPLVAHGLAPLLRQPDGLWGRPRVTATMTPQPGCTATESCNRAVTEMLQRRAISGVAPSGDYPSHPPAAGGVTVERGVSYVEPPEAARAGDLYVPRSTGRKHPALLLIRGGTWEQGVRGPTTARLASELAAHGYLVYDINVRLVSQGGAFPGDIQDVKIAATFLRTHAALFDIDPWKIGAVGADSGGYLAMMAAYTPNSGMFASPLYAETPGRIAAVASLWAPADLAREARGGVDSPTAAAMQGYLNNVSYAADPALYGIASPTKYVDGGVATILFHGVNDTQESFRQTFRLYRYLKQRSVSAQLIDVPGSPRGFGIMQGPQGNRIMRQMLAFFDGIFYRARQAPVSK